MFIELKFVLMFQYLNSFSALLEFDMLNCDINYVIDVLGRILWNGCVHDCCVYIHSIFIAN